MNVGCDQHNKYNIFVSPTSLLRNLGGISQWPTFSSMNSSSEALLPQTYDFETVLTTDVACEEGYGEERVHIETVHR